MPVTISIANATVSGEWIEGDIVLGVTEISFSTSKHFKTKKDVWSRISIWVKESRLPQD